MQCTVSSDLDLEQSGDKILKRHTRANPRDTIGSSNLVKLGKQVGKTPDLGQNADADLPCSTAKAPKHSCRAPSNKGWDATSREVKINAANRTCSWCSCKYGEPKFAHVHNSTL